MLTARLARPTAPPRPTTWASARPSMPTSPPTRCT